MNGAKATRHLALAGLLAATLGALVIACGTGPDAQPNPPTGASTSPAAVTVTQTRTPTITATATATAPVTQTITVSAWPSPPGATPTAQAAPPATAPVTAPNTTPTPGMTVATVASVHDGDTLTLTDGTKVRVLGIQAPEIPPAGNECYGEQATQAAQNLMPAGTEVTLQPDPAQPSPDPYGRTLAYVGTPDGDLGALMISAGAARVYVQYPVAKTSMYQALQDEAFAGQRGLWATPENGGCPNG